MNLLDKKTLCHVFSFTYRTMIASVPLLEFAIPKSDGVLRAYYEQHVSEERGHDEMLKDDLLRLGVEEIPVYHEAAQIAGSQYYLIAHDHPALLLGYMHALEMESLPLDAVDALCVHHGVELKALRHHATHDPNHNRDIERMISSLDSGLRERVNWNERNVTKAFTEAFSHDQ